LSSPADAADFRGDLGVAIGEERQFLWTDQIGWAGAIAFPLR
jgi:hypothetical protein